MNDREPQAATLAERTVEGLKQRLGLLGGHTDPFVGHRQDADGKSVDYFVGSTEPKPAALGHRLERVEHDVAQRAQPVNPCGRPFVAGQAHQIAHRAGACAHHVSRGEHHDYYVAALIVGAKQREHLLAGNRQRQRGRPGRAGRGF